MHFFAVATFASIPTAIFCRFNTIFMGWIGCAKNSDHFSITTLSPISAKCVVRIFRYCGLACARKKDQGNSWDRRCERAVYFYAQFCFSRFFTYPIYKKKPPSENNNRVFLNRLLCIFCEETLFAYKGVDYKQLSSCGIIIITLFHIFFPWLELR